MSAELVPLIAGAAPRISLSRPVLLIGRHPECDIRIELPRISRRHCCLATVDDRVVIRDLGSRNGVRVNGRVIDEMRLFPDDEVAIGPILYRFVGAVEARPPATAPLARPVHDSFESQHGPIPLDSDSEIIPLVEP